MNSVLSERKTAWFLFIVVFFVAFRGGICAECFIFSIPRLRIAHCESRIKKAPVRVLFFLFHLNITCIKLIVLSALGDKLVVVALFDDFTVFENNYILRVSYR